MSTMVTLPNNPGGFAYVTTAIRCRRAVTRGGLLRRGPAAGRAGLQQKLPPEDQRILGGIILPVGRYPLLLSARLDVAIAEALDPAHPKRVFRTLGRS